MPARRTTSGGKAAPARTDARRKARTDLRAQLAQQRSLDGLERMRARGLSLTQAAAQAGTTPRTMPRHVGRALKKREDGRFAPTTRDRLPRTMRFLTENGGIDLILRDLIAASDHARHMGPVDENL